MLALFATALAAAGCGSDRLPETDTARRSDRAGREHFRFFSPTSFWNTALPADAPLDPESTPLVAGLVAEIGAEQAAGIGPWIGTTRFSVPIYTVGANLPTVKVTLASPVHSPALQAAFARVPLPAGALPSGGTDAHLVVWQPATDRLWEFWRLARTAAGPQASWGGAMRDVSSSSGVYGRDSWPGAEPWWGASASSLSIAGGLIGLEDLRRGEIDHALAIALPEIRAGVYSSPARRTDGRSRSPLALPEGARLRLDPDLDVGALKLPRTTRLIAEAAQRYGIVVRDGSSIVQLFAEDPITAPRNPYNGLDGYFEGNYPNQVLADFPWDELELLRMRLHRDR